MIGLIVGSSFIAIFFIALFIAWYLIRSAKIKERLLVIEKGIDIKDLSSLLEKKSNFPWLKIGIVTTGIAIGALVVSLIMISDSGEKFKSMPGFSIAVILFFAGVSMILANFVDRPKDQIK